MHQKNDTKQQNQELADFTDQALGSQRGVSLSAASLDEELIGLEKTILRLRDSFPTEEPNEAKTRQMLLRLKAQIRREEEAAAEKKTFWQRLFNLQASPQLAMLAGIAMIVFMVVVGLPEAQPATGSEFTGTAFSNLGVWPALGLTGLLVLLIWISRRK